MFSSLLSSITHYFKSVFYYDLFLMSCFVIDCGFNMTLIMLSRSQ
ncbi:hypothetical protein Xentx_00053 [Xenorhabdus thuongxuanensis]|uniref:Uncharacterized protein n=1 Tax=Xenorhabdus thuongxuanensis TaxID=1873484 RepID=A0A1Q5U930_9GAMM|nr:hypothetical protein Xentx_00053 [Xenorhabdus thuongxuanensis]